MIVLDTSVVLAFMDRTDTNHETVRSWIEANDEELVTTPLVLAELDHLVGRYGGAIATRALRKDLASGAYQVELVANGHARDDRARRSTRLDGAGAHRRLAARARGTYSDQRDRDARRTALPCGQAGVRGGVHPAARRRGLIALTNGFSKKLDNHMAAIALHFIHYNFARPHTTLADPYPRTPAMAAGVADHVWTITDIAALLG